MRIPFNVLDKQFYKYQNEYEKKVIDILRSGNYILGSEVEKFEKEFAEYIGAKFAIGVDNGLNALVLVFRALEINKEHEVIVQGNTYIASVMGISMNNAKPVFVEPDEYFNIDISKIEEKITEKTKAILVTHLYGQASNMEKITELCKKYNLYLVEDCAQSHGAQFNKKMTGNFGIGCFSFYPSKNLGAFGDAGAIVTNDEILMKKIKMLRNYGSNKRYYNEVVGYNSRLDEIQAGLLRIKLSHIEELTKERENIAKEYLEKINNSKIELPKLRENATSVWHLFVIKTKNREEFQKYMEKNGIGTVIHYPIPPHLSKAYNYLEYSKGDLPITEELAEEVISLPLYIGMTKDEIDYVVDIINKY